MSYIRRPLTPSFPCDDTTRALFVAARYAMNLALISWLNACPAADDVDLEADASCAIIRQLAALSRGGAS